MIRNTIPPALALLGTVFLASATISSVATEPKPSIKITAPKDAEEVDRRPVVAGWVEDPKAAVFVIVHPVECQERWVQPDTGVDPDGTWRVRVFIGRPDEADDGKSFEIMAVANPDDRLQSGQTLQDWPAAEWKSEVITVKRKKSQ